MYDRLKQWDSSEDRPALIGLGFAAVVAVWASSNLVTVIVTIHMSEYYGLHFQVYFWNSAANLVYLKFFDYLMLMYNLL